jgi:oligopeptide/dipeptide ABC transporter ATP-binding protein
MYAGQLVELASAREIFHRPRHPYTSELLKALPTAEGGSGELAVIPGEIPDLERPPSGCRFSPRCGHRMAVCDKRPPLEPVDASEVACWLYTEQENQSADRSKAESV